MKDYPPPLSTHRELCTNPGVFAETLRRFHSLMGTKFMIPVIGGKDLNLHLLYVEVTKRGGLEKVIIEKRWREVISIFNFPPTTTSASFVLRKYYLSLLHHFEQLYFFGSRGALLPPSEALQGRNSQSDMVTRRIPSVGKSAALDTEAPSGRPTSTLQSARPADGVDSFSASATVPHTVNGSPPSTAGGSPCNFTVTGTIDGKFDYGYLVTVKIGSQLLHGVLYHIHQPQIGSPSPSINIINNNQQQPASSTINPNIPKRKSVGRKPRLKYPRDPARPKHNRSAYNFFFAEKHSELKAQGSHFEGVYSKRIGESWNKLTDEERQLYEAYARRDKERYRIELQAYKERLKFFEPKQSQQFARVTEIGRREMIESFQKAHHPKEELCHSAGDAELPGQEASRKKMQDFVERDNVRVLPEESGSSAIGGARIEDSDHSAMEADVLNSTNSTDLREANLAD